LGWQTRDWNKGGFTMEAKSSSIKKIRKAMEKTLDPKRFEHTLGVAYTAAALAMRYGYDMQKAQTAGLLHDCAKCMSNEKRLHICRKHNITVNEIERRNPFLLHAKVGSYLAMRKYNIHDSDVINAILNHTTGRPDMSLLEKIVYVADYIEPGRKQAPNLGEIRRLAFTDLDAALFKILNDTLVYLNQVDGETDPMTQKTYDFYKAKVTGTK
jgi:putative HD superfamily hydrolase of NAD metabolism